MAMHYYNPEQKSSKFIGLWNFLRSRKAELESKAWVKQADLRDRLLELDRHLGEILSET